MCELFGFSSEEEYVLNDILKEFFSHSDENPDGWGMAMFYGNAVSVEKEPVDASRSAYLQARLAAPIRTSRLLAHIRRASVGSLRYTNCHPFVQRDGRNRCWTLIHNGTIFHSDALTPYEKVQEGSTDSERILLYLMDNINAEQAKVGRVLSPEERFSVINRSIAAVSEGNKVNIILYDSDVMYVHSNMAETLYSCRIGGGIAFATKPLATGNWESVPLSAVFAYRNGRLLFSGQPSGHIYTPSEDQLRQLEEVRSALCAKEA